MNQRFQLKLNRPAGQEILTGRISTTLESFGWKAHREVSKDFIVFTTNREQNMVSSHRDLLQRLKEILEPGDINNLEIVAV